MTPAPLWPLYFDFTCTQPEPAPAQQAPSTSPLNVPRPLENNLFLSGTLNQQLIQRGYSVEFCFQDFVNGYLVELTNKVIIKSFLGSDVPPLLQVKNEPNIDQVCMNRELDEVYFLKGLEPDFLGRRRIFRTYVDSSLNHHSYEIKQNGNFWLANSITAKPMVDIEYQASGGINHMKALLFLLGVEVYLNAEEYEMVKLMFEGVAAALDLSTQQNNESLQTIPPKNFAFRYLVNSELFVLVYETTNTETQNLQNNSSANFDFTLLDEDKNTLNF